MLERAEHPAGLPCLIGTQRLRYVDVDSADAAASAVWSAGGRVIVAPVDVPRGGRLAILADPDGVVFGAWQAAERLPLRAAG